jgi:yeast amino acid transporter
MIAITAVIGVGLYNREGSILQMSGQGAVFLSFALVGFLAWSVTQCVAEMVRIWPVRSALTGYVTEFVDKELGIAVGIAYWYVSEYLIAQACS